MAGDDIDGYAAARWDQKPQSDREQILKKAGYRKLKKAKGGGYVNPGMFEAYKDDDFEPDPIAPVPPKKSK